MLTDQGPTAERVVFLREIAEGPMSSLVAGRRRVANTWRRVAIKVLALTTRRDAELLQGAVHNSRILASFRHRHLVCAEDLARVGPCLALVSPWIEGVDLVDAVEVLRERNMALPPRAICEVLRSTAVALDAALYRVPSGADAPLGQIHRDLKPTNLMIDRDGELKVLDFGTGFTSLAGRTARSRALQKGLAKYMSPARRDGKRDGASGDVYALGILGIELFRGRWLLRLHGNNPDHDRYLAETVARIEHLGLGSGADEMLVRNLLLRMVAFDIDARPSADEIANTFRSVADRASGPTLESFAVEHLRAHIPVVAAIPDDGMDGRYAEIVRSVEEIPEVTDGLPAEAAADASEWEETDRGWKLVEELDDLDEDSGEIPRPVVAATAAPASEVGPTPSPATPRSRTPAPAAARTPAPAPRSPAPRTPAPANRTGRTSGNNPVVPRPAPLPAPAAKSNEDTTDQATVWERVRETAPPTPVPAPRAPAPVSNSGRYAAAGLAMAIAAAVLAGAVVLAVLAAALLR